MTAKVTPLPKRTRTPELEPMDRADFEDSCIVDHLDGVVGEAILEKCQESADSMWQVLR